MYKIIGHYPPQLSFQTFIGLLIVFWLLRKAYKYITRIFRKKKPQGDMAGEDVLSKEA